MVLYARSTMTTTDDAARSAVLDAADRLFYSKGVQAVGMDQLRTAAGIPLKRIYQLFPSKDEILRQVLIRRNEEWTRRVLAKADAAGSPREKLLSVYDFLGEWFREDDFRGCAFINSFGELGAVDPEVASFARQHKESFQRYLHAPPLPVHGLSGGTRLGWHLWVRLQARNWDGG
jgi:AcrR family transcriptional regulator